jgi:hypothetical protein
MLRPLSRFSLRLMTDNVMPIGASLSRERTGAAHVNAVLASRDAFAPGADQAAR